MTTLVKTSLLSLISTGTKMLAGLLISKALATFVGPTGLAIVGQFQNFIQLVMTAAKGAIDTGVTKYTAEFSTEPERLPALFSTAIRISLVSSLLVGLLLILARDELSSRLLHSPGQAYVVAIFGLTIGLFVVNNLLLSILNGLREVRRYIAINVIQSLVTLVLTGGLIVRFGLDGALIALVTNQSVVLFVVLWMLRRHPVIRFEDFRQRFDRSIARRLSGYALMSVVSAVVAPLTTMLVRDHITRSIGLREAGYWQGAWYISTIYLTIVTTSLSTYYLPKLSATSDPGLLRHELRAGYMTIMPVVAAMALSVYLLRGVIVDILFTAEFEPMRPLFAWMLIGDVVKLASWLLSYLMLAKAMTREFIATEIVFSASFVLLSMALTPGFGVEGVMYAHAINYALYLVAMVILTRRIWSVRAVAA